MDAHASDFMCTVCNWHRIKKNTLLFFVVVKMFYLRFISIFVITNENMSPIVHFPKVHPDKLNTSIANIANVSLRPATIGCHSRYLLILMENLSKTLFHVVSTIHTYKYKFRRSFLFRPVYFVVCSMLCNVVLYIFTSALIFIFSSRHS